jgi:hypothetical protein
MKTLDLEAPKVTGSEIRVHLNYMRNMDQTIDLKEEQAKIFSSQSVPIGDFIRWGRGSGQDRKWKD